MIKNKITADNFEILINCDTQNGTSPRGTQYLMKNYYTPKKLEFLNEYISK